jgi:hypothetical protein
MDVGSVGGWMDEWMDEKKKTKVLAYNRPWGIQYSQFRRTKLGAI